MVRYRIGGLVVNELKIAGMNFGLEVLDEAQSGLDAILGVFDEDQLQAAIDLCNKSFRGDGTVTMTDFNRMYLSLPSMPGPFMSGPSAAHLEEIVELAWNADAVQRHKEWRPW